MSVLVGTLAMVSAWVPEQFATTQTSCIFAMVAASLLLGGLAIGQTRVITIVKGSPVPSNPISGIDGATSAASSRADVGTGLRGSTFVAECRRDEVATREKDAPGRSVDGLPVEVLRRLALYAVLSTSPAIATEIDAPSALSQIERKPRVVRSALGIVGCVFVTVVGVGVVVAQLERGGEISLFSSLLLLGIFVVATWFLHLGLSCRWRATSTNRGNAIEQFGLFGYRRKAEIPKDVESVWFLSNVEPSPRYLLFTSKRGWENQALD